jgi:hypothetical protein
MGGLPCRRSIFLGGRKLQEGIEMDRKLHLLESFTAQGPDGQAYKVFGYEHLVRDETFAGPEEHWEPTGVSEYRLADGRHVDLAPDGTVRFPETEGKAVAA